MLRRLPESLSSNMLVITAMLLISAVAGCRPGAGPATSPATDETRDPARFTATPGHAPSPQARIPTISVSATLSSMTPGPSAPTPVVKAGPGPPFEVVFSLQLGQDGIEYRGLDVPDMQVTGPDNLAALADGVFVLSDLIGNRLLWYSPAGELQRAVDLYELDILNVSDLLAMGEELVLLEVSFQVAPERYRVHRLSVTGDLLASYDLPEGLHLGDGLTGIAAGCGGEIYVELEGGSRVYRLAESNGEYSFDVSSEGYACGGRYYRLLTGSSAFLGGARVETVFTHSAGGLFLLQANIDGSSYVIREDVVTEAMIIVDQTVHFLDARGRQVGVARVPIDERLYYVPGGLAVGPDGEVYHLTPRREQLDIVRLNFYWALDPLVPDAQPPHITTLESDS